MADLSANVVRGQGRSLIMPPISALSRLVTAEAVRLSQTINVAEASFLGQLTFTASADHATVISYEARIRWIGTSTIVDTVALGKPTPVGGVITVDLSAELEALAEGYYEVVVAATDAGGTTESSVSNVFSVPLIAA